MPKEDRRIDGRDLMSPTKMFSQDVKRLTLCFL